MQEEKRRWLMRTLRKIGRGLDLARKITLNLVFFVLLIVLLAWLLGSDVPDVPGKAVLVLDIKGDIVEQLTGDPVERAFQKAVSDDAEPETLLKDLVDAIRAGRDDPRIQALLLDLNHMGGARLTMLEDLGRELAEFKKTGKQLLATADDYDMNRYYLAAMADEVYLHWMGAVILDGFSRYKMYFKEGLDRLEVDMHIHRVGEYKSAAEPFLRNDMSEEAREANREYLGDLWRSYLEEVAAARKLKPQDLIDYTASIREGLARTGWDTAKLAREAGLVDRVGGRELVRLRLTELVGEDEETHSYHRVDFDDYLRAAGGDRFGAEADGDLIGVVVARGTIMDGEQPPGQIGGDSTAALIRKARKDENIKAIVLRVDSGGGSAFASEVIRQEFALAREQGKPVVVSMGGVAASGGYWISTAADEIWASPNTITGSIGIIGMVPTFQTPRAKYLGIGVDGVGTTWLAGAFRLDREMKPELDEMLKNLIEKGYREFLDRVAKARNKTVEEVDKIARGRVWSGADAKELGLIDKLGGLDQAITSAARLAKLEDYRVKYVEKKLEFTERLLLDLLAKSSRTLGPSSRALASRSPHQKLLGALADQLRRLEEFNDPHGVYAHCLCD